MMNVWAGEGRITEDLQLHKTTDGVSVLRFTIAVDKHNAKKLREAGKPSTNFIRCLAWRGTAENIAQFFKKGSGIGITGSIETGSYKDEDGKTIYTQDIAVSNFSFPIQEPKREAASLNEFSTVDDVLDAAADDLPF